MHIVTRPPGQTLWGQQCRYAGGYGCKHWIYVLSSLAWQFNMLSFLDHCRTTLFSPFGLRKMMGSSERYPKMGPQGREFSKLWCLNIRNMRLACQAAPETSQGSFSIDVSKLLDDSSSFFHTYSDIQLRKVLHLAEFQQSHTDNMC